MKLKTTAKKQLFKFVSFTSASVIYALLFSSLASPVSAAEKRFNAPDLNSSLDDFSKRLNASSLNVDFIVAQALNNSRRLKREGDRFRQTAEYFSNQVEDGVSQGFDNNSNTAISNSVIIPPGVKADTIIVINQNDGDSYAIQR